jgi:hypothetical protein
MLYFLFPVISIPFESSFNNRIGRSIDLVMENRKGFDQNPINYKILKNLKDHLSSIYRIMMML